MFGISKNKKSYTDFTSYIKLDSNGVVYQYDKDPGVTSAPMPFITYDYRNTSSDVRYIDKVIKEITHDIENTKLVKKLVKGDIAIDITERHYNINFDPHRMYQSDIGYRTTANISYHYNLYKLTIYIDYKSQITDKDYSIKFIVDTTAELKQNYKLLLDKGSTGTLELLSNIATIVGTLKFWP